MDENAKAGRHSENISQDTETLLLCPVYNAEKSLPELIQRIDTVCGVRHLLIIDDGSSDSSVEFVSREKIKSLNLKENRGKGAALKTGFRWAQRHNYHYVLAIDSDLQHAPEDIPKFLNRNRKAPEALLLGCRDFRSGSMPWPRQFSNNLSSLLISIFSGARVRDSQCGFRLLPLSLLKYAPAESNRFMYESETLFMLGACGAKIEEVQIKVIYNDSQSNINPLAVIVNFIGLFWRRLWY